MARDLSQSGIPASIGFASTSWTLVMSAVRDEEGGDALDRLCGRYWKPVYIYVRRDGYSPADAEDATQDFFAYILQRSWLKKTSEERGSFRGYMLALLRNFLANRRRYNSAQKRRGPFPVNPAELGELEQLVASEADPSTAYDRTWATCITQSALEQLRREQESAGNSARFQAVRAFLSNPPTTSDYDRIERELAEPRNRISVYRHRLTRRYGELIRAEVADTVSDPCHVAIELRRLVEVLSSS